MCCLTHFFSACTRSLIYKTRANTEWLAEQHKDERSKEMKLSSTKEKECPQNSRVVEVAQWLRVLSALPEGLGSVTNTQTRRLTTTYNCSSRGSYTFLRPVQALHS